MADDNEEVLEDEEHVLKIEAQEAVKEIRFAVQFVEMSSKLKHTQELVYFNMTTKENTKYCVELSAQGFRVKKYTTAPHPASIPIHGPPWAQASRIWSVKQ
jgi:hypothetical protein